MSNVQLLVFYSAKDNFTLYANATNWDRFGFEAISLQSSKFISMCFDKMCHIKFVRLNKHLGMSLNIENDNE
jgi:hypothetical protein